MGLNAARQDGGECLTLTVLSLHFTDIGLSPFCKIYAGGSLAVHLWNDTNVKNAGKEINSAQEKQRWVPPSIIAAGRTMHLSDISEICKKKKTCAPLGAEGSCLSATSSHAQPWAGPQPAVPEGRCRLTDAEETDGEADSGRTLLLC